MVRYFAWLTGWGILHGQWGGLCIVWVDRLSVVMVSMAVRSTLPDPMTDYLCRFSLLRLGITMGQYACMGELRQLAHPPSSLPQRPISWPPCPTPIRIPLLSHYLQSHPDQEFAGFVLRGLTDGFHVGCFSQSSGLCSSSRNHPSSLANSQVIARYIREEVAGGRMVGPLDAEVQGMIHCSPIGLVPKGRGTGQWRMIVDLSYPSDRSVNDGIAASLCSMRYSSLDDAIQFITRLGPGTLLTKIDLKSAYRVVPVHPQDRHLLGIRWEGRVFADQALPFGLRSAPKLFSAVADAIGWALFQTGVLFQIHYLDDYLFFSPPTPGDAIPALPHILNTLDRMGVPVAISKIEGPATIVTFLGIIVDTVRFELRLPEEKLSYIRGLVTQWRGRRSGRYKDFESLLGHLSHAATVIRQGRIFLQHLFAILKATRSHSHFVHLDAVARADLLWWDNFLQHWNGLMFFPQFPAPTSHVYSDASGTFGCGAVLLPSHWFRFPWPESWSSMDISVKELVPIVVAAALWGSWWRRSQVCFHSDNMAVVAMLRKRSARGEVAHHLLRCLYFYTAFYQFDYTAEHVPGIHNTAADALSRNNTALVSSLFPQAAEVQVPASLMDLLVSQRPNWGSTHWIALFMDTLPTL